MTNEEAIFCLKGIKNTGHDIFTEQKDFQECLDMAIKALERESCEDCVSRQAVDQNIYDYAESNGLSYANLKNAILDMPPVTPTRKKGKWIVKENIHGLEKFYECSNCGNHCLYEYVEIGFKNAKTKYCPNCGAEMDCVTHDDVFDNVVKEMTHEERVLIELTRDMPKKMGVLYIQSFQQDHGPFTDEAAEIIREYLSKE
jgi:transcription elongation factor Elf1